MGSCFASAALLHRWQLKFIDFLKLVWTFMLAPIHDGRASQCYSKDNRLDRVHFSYLFNLEMKWKRWIFSQLNKHVISLMYIESCPHHVHVRPLHLVCIIIHHWIIINLSLSVSTRCSNYSLYILHIRHYHKYCNEEKIPYTNDTNTWKYSNVKRIFLSFEHWMLSGSDKVFSHFLSLII